MIAAVPLLGSLTVATDLGPPSTSVSLPSTLIAFDPLSSFTVAVSSTATGLSPTQSTVTATVAVSPPGASV